LLIADYKDTLAFENLQLAIGNWQLEIGNQNALNNISLLTEVPCRESAGPGVLHSLRHALDDRSRTNFFTL